MILRARRNSSAAVRGRTALSGRFTATVGTPGAGRAPPALPPRPGTVCRLGAHGRDPRPVGGPEWPPAAPEADPATMWCSGLAPAIYAATRCLRKGAVLLGPENDGDLARLGAPGRRRQAAAAGGAAARRRRRLGGAAARPSRCPRPVPHGELRRALRRLGRAAAGCLGRQARAVCLHHAALLSALCHAHEYSNVRQQQPALQPSLRPPVPSAHCLRERYRWLKKSPRTQTAHEKDALPVFRPAHSVPR